MSRAGLVVSVVGGDPVAYSVRASTAAAIRENRFQRIQEFQHRACPWPRPVKSFASWKVSSILQRRQMFSTRVPRAASPGLKQR